LPRGIENLRDVPRRPASADESFVRRGARPATELDDAGSREGDHDEGEPELGVSEAVVQHVVSGVRA